MKQKSSKNMLDLAFEAFKNKKLCDSLIASEFPLNTAELFGYLNSPAKDTSNNYSAYTTKFKQQEPWIGSMEWIRFQLAFCNEKYPNRSSEIDEKSIEETMEVLNKLYISSRKKYMKQVAPQVITDTLRYGAIFAAIVAGASAVASLVGLILEVLLMVIGIGAKIGELSLPFFYYTAIPAIALSVFLHISWCLVRPNEESFFNKEIKPALIEEVQNKEIEMKVLVQAPSF